MIVSAPGRMKPLAHWTVGEAAHVLGARTPAGAEAAAFGAISTDTRTIEPGQFFLAIRGEKFDGARFCRAAVEKGAAGLIVAQDFPPDFDGRVPVLRAADPLKAYGDLAAHQRGAWGGPLIAISGSVGKTTTRRLAADALSPHMRVLEPIRNFNNLIGVPVTLLGLEESHRIAVLELGMNQPGELERLARIASPTVAGLTRIGLAHAGMFASIEDLIEAKLELFEQCAARTPLVINAACPHSRRAVERLGRSHPIVRFRAEGDEPAEITIENIHPIEPVGHQFDLVTPEGRVDGLRFLHFGRHLIEDAAAAAALLLASGHPPAWIAEAVRNYRPMPMRGETIQAGPWTFILDCYNAAPASMLGALQSLGPTPSGGRTLLVLADMLELGEHARAAHEALLEPLRRLNPDLLLGLGPETARLIGKLKNDGAIEARAFEDRDALTDHLREALEPGDRVLFKGAHAFALEEIARALAPEAPIRAASP